MSKYSLKYNISPFFVNLWARAHEMPIFFMGRNLKPIFLWVQISSPYFLLSNTIFPHFASIYGHEHMIRPYLLWVGTSNPYFLWVRTLRPYFLILSSSFFRQFMGTSIRDAHIFYGYEPQTHIIYG